MARRAKICGLTAPNGVPVYSKRSYRKLCGLLGAMLLGQRDIDPESFLRFVRNVRDRLSYFLEMIDRCDVCYFAQEGSTLVFLVLADNEDNLPLIRNAIAQERRLLDELGIDPRAVDLSGDRIRISVPMPSAEQTLN